MASANPRKDYTAVLRCTIVEYEAWTKWTKKQNESAKLIEWGEKTEVRMKGEESGTLAAAWGLRGLVWQFTLHENNKTRFNSMNMFYQIEPNTHDGGIHLHIVSKNTTPMQWASWMREFEVFMTESGDKHGFDVALTPLRYRHRNGRDYNKEIDANQFISTYFMGKKHASQQGPKSLWTHAYLLCMTIGRWPQIEFLIRDCMWGPKAQKTFQIYNRDTGTNTDDDGGKGLPLPETLGDLSVSKHVQKQIDISNLCAKEGILSATELRAKKPETYFTIASSPQGRQKIETIIEAAKDTYRKRDILSILLKNTEFPTDGNALAYILQANRIPIWPFLKDMLGILQGTMGKRNCIYLWGQPSTGKTQIIQPLAQKIKLYGSHNQNNDNFPFTDCADKMLIWCDEIQVTARMIETWKLLTCGQRCRVDVKHKESAAITRTPIICTSNNSPWMVMEGNVNTWKHEPALRTRIIEHTFNIQIELPRQVSIGDWQELILLYQNKPLEPMICLHAFQKDWVMKTKPCCHCGQNTLIERNAEDEEPGPSRKKQRLMLGWDADENGSQGAATCVKHLEISSSEDEN